MTAILSHQPARLIMGCGTAVAAGLTAWADVPGYDPHAPITLAQWTMLPETSQRYGRSSIMAYPTTSYPAISPKRPCDCISLFPAGGPAPKTRRCEGKGQKWRRSCPTAIIRVLREGVPPWRHGDTSQRPCASGNRGRETYGRNARRGRPLPGGFAHLPRRAVPGCSSKIPLSGAVVGGFRPSPFENDFCMLERSRSMLILRGCRRSTQSPLQQ